MALNTQLGHYPIHQPSDLLPPREKYNSSIEPSKNKHKTSPEITRRNVKPRENPGINAITISNRFVLLEIPNKDIPESRPSQKKPPPPPIYLDDAIDIQTMTKTLVNLVSTDKFKVNNNQVKTISNNLDSYRKIIKLLKMLNANFHTFQLKQQTFSCSPTQLTLLSRLRRIKGRTFTARTRK